MNFSNWGTIDYLEAWSRQQLIFNRLLEQKQLHLDTKGLEEIVFCEHPHVYTLGKNGKPNNLLINEDFLEKINASFHKIDRGGDITYHGSGQIVGYPILDLENYKLSLKEYIYLLEEVIIRTLAEVGIVSERLEGATGVWIEKDTPRARKICAIGVRASRYVTMHGYALNVNTNLEYYNYINPCGFVDKGVTSIQKETGITYPIEEISDLIKKYFQLLMFKK